MTVSINDVAQAEFDKLEPKLPNIDKIVSGELTEWSISNVSILYAVSVSLVQAIASDPVAENDARIANVLNFMLDNFKGQHSLNVIMVSILTLDRNGISVDNVKGIKNQQRFKKVLDNAQKTLERAR